jgi:hypothetical protein
MKGMPFRFRLFAASSIVRNSAEGEGGEGRERTSKRESAYSYQASFYAKKLD